MYPDHPIPCRQCRRFHERWKGGVCSATCEHGGICCLSTDHSGDHRSLGPMDETICEWKN